MLQLFSFRQILYLFFYILLIGFVLPLPFLFFVLDDLTNTFARALPLSPVIATLIALPWRILWKFPIIRYFGENKYPDLTGEWDITIKWHDLVKEGIGEVRGTAQIKCSLTKISIAVETEGEFSGSSSRTLACAPKISEGGIQELIYVYKNQPRNKPGTKSKSQLGAACLRIKNKLLLEGDYWTDTQTKGYIILSKRGKKS